MLLPLVGAAQQYSIDWHKVAGGGGTGAGGNYAVSGTISQADAGGAMSGGNYSVSGGYWSFVAVVASPGTPNLIIAANGPGSIKILWPNTGNYILKQSSTLAPGSWAASTYLVTTANGTNSVTIPTLAAGQFFRLSAQ